MKNDIAEDSKSGAATDLADVREISLASLGSLAGAGLLDRVQVSTTGVSVAAFNSSI
ncbi:hypothetical protein [Sphaerisporangium fuscum]|uniref:hypothetical protein n=1 Tax=Sphaerisporangium fuscum TaxID=2835868 RepID=UPI001BDBFBBA|nr:hypothetical protein [Sphaerisporangium fuscum]